MSFIDRENSRSNFGTIKNQKLVEINENVRFNSHNKSEFLELLEYASTYFLLGYSSFLIYLFFSLIWVPISRTRSYPPSVFMTLSSHSFLSPPRSDKATNPLFSSRSQNCSPTHCLASNELSPATRGMSRSVSSPDVRTVFYEPPPILYPKERIWYKDFDFKPSCLPTLPRRRFDKKAGIRVSIRDDFQKRDLCEGEASDPKIINSQTQVVVTAMTYALYHHFSIQLAYAVPFLPQIVPIIVKTAIATLPNIKTPESEPQAFDKLAEAVVNYLPIIDSGINVYDAIRKKNTISVEKIIQMETSSVDTKVKETLLSAIDDSGLIVAVTEAKKRDIKGIKEMDGSSHRFTTVEELWRSDDIEDAQMAFRQGNPIPLYSRIAATQFLCGWDSLLIISPGAPQLRQRILDNTLAFQTRMRIQLNKIVVFKKPVSQSDPFFTQFHIWANSMPYMRENLDATEKNSLKKTDQYWQEIEPQLIESSFQKGCEKYQEKCGTKISAIDRQSFIKQFIDKKFL